MQVSLQHSHYCSFGVDMVPQSTAVHCRPSQVSLLLKYMIADGVALIGSACAGKLVEPLRPKLCLLLSCADHHSLTLVFLMRSTLCDPYLNLFRGIIPPLNGTIDLSPILAFIALDVSPYPVICLVCAAIAVLCMACLGRHHACVHRVSCLTYRCN